MMFATRCLVISFSVFVIVYATLSLVVCFAWRRIWRYSQRYPVRLLANLLFALRISPLVVAAGVTVLVTVPSFLMLEPRAIDEPVGVVPVLLTGCGAALGIFGVLNMGMAVRRASRALTLWTCDAKTVKAAAAFPVLRISRPVPAMAVAGVVRPRILLSCAAERALTREELQAALQHEVAHARRRDNLKKLLLRLVTFPGLSGLDVAWIEASEMAADDAAVSSAGEALDLAAALLKLSCLARACTPADLTAALVHTHGAASAINVRVGQLIAWHEQSNRSARQCSPWYGLPAAAATVVFFSVTYSQLLVQVHTATEWLVR
jgi:beta-lactamase regulating signal transducer with metallopeptidase domain